VNVWNPRRNASSEIAAAASSIFNASSSSASVVITRCSSARHPDTEELPPDGSTRGVSRFLKVSAILERRMESGSRAQIGRAILCRIFAKARTQRVDRTMTMYVQMHSTCLANPAGSRNRLMMSRQMRIDTTIAVDHDASLSSLSGRRKTESSIAEAGCHPMFWGDRK
jgi:hypothetical protein